MHVQVYTDEQSTNSICYIYIQLIYLSLFMWMGGNQSTLASTKLQKVFLSKLATTFNKHYKTQFFF